MPKYHLDHSGAFHCFNNRGLAAQDCTVLENKGTNSVCDRHTSGFRLRTAQWPAKENVLVELPNGRNQPFAALALSAWQHLPVFETELECSVARQVVTLNSPKSIRGRNRQPLIGIVQRRSSGEATNGRPCTNWQAGHLDVKRHHSQREIFQATALPAGHAIVSCRCNVPHVHPWPVLASPRKRKSNIEWLARMSSIKVTRFGAAERVDANAPLGAAGTNLHEPVCSYLLTLFTKISSPPELS